MNDSSDDPEKTHQRTSRSHGGRKSTGITDRALKLQELLESKRNGKAMGQGTVQCT